MNGDNNQLNAMDFISMVNFFIGLANYGKNVDQVKLNTALQSAADDIHDHLRHQDEKIDVILDLMKGDHKK